METRQEVQKPKRFRIVRLEDRIVPSHLPHVAEVVVGSPAAENAPTHAHKVGFAVMSKQCGGASAVGATTFC